MTTADIIAVGSGHNGLVAAAYLAAAGKKVLVLERNAWFGGGVVTRELTRPGFRHDQHSMSHIFIQGNPLLANDELRLKSRYGLEYIFPHVPMMSVFEDGTTLKLYRDPEKSAAERRLADLEAKVKALGGVPEENEDEPGKKGQAGGGEDLAKAVAAAVAEAVKPLRDEIANFKQGRVTETRKQRLGTVIGRLPEHLRKGYSRIGVDGLTDDEFDKLVTETEAEVDEIVSKENARGAVLGRPLGAGGNGGSHSGAEKEATDEEAKAVADRLGI